MKIAASLLPKQMEIEKNRSRPVRELSDAELLVIIEETEAKLHQIETEMRAVETLNGIAAILQDGQTPHEERVAIAITLIDEFSTDRAAEPLEQGST